MRALLNKTVLVTSILSSVLLQACATGQGTSFATRVGSGSAGDTFSEQASSSDENASFSEDAGFSEPIVLASSGNVLLPGAFTNTPGFAGLAGYDLLPGLTPETGLGGNGLNSAFGGGITIQQNDGGAPQVTVNGGVDVASLGTPGAALSPLVSATQAATPGVPNILVGGNGSSLASAGPAGISVAGRPLASPGGGVGSVLSTSGAVAGVAGGAGSIVSGTNPGSAASQVVNAVAGVTAAVISTPPPAGSPPPAAGAPPVSGLGGLTGMLPPLLR